jgi:hypothetical protein
VRIGARTLLNEISQLLAKHKLIPFLGAGVSRPQLGFGAPELRSRLAESLPEPPAKELGLADVAQLIEDTEGAEALLTRLRALLCRGQFDDATGTAHLLVMSLGCGLIYTTNQDNIYELAATKYRHPHKVVVGVRDLAEAGPGQQLLIKFHGDLAVPDSLVFTSSSYAKRLAGPDNALDTRLRSHLLGKGLLFIGYSFQDENLRELLRQIRRAFGGETPASYMIAFDYQPEMEFLASEFNVRVVNPREIFPEAANNADAFERCLQALCHATMRIRSERHLESTFMSGDLIAPVLIEHELVALEQVVAGENFSTALKAFRANTDLHLIPEHLQRRVAEAFVTVAEKAATDSDLKALKAAVFNLELEPIHALVVMARYMAATRIRAASGGFDPAYMIASPCMSEAMWPLAAAHAVEMLIGGGYAITDGFRQMATHWFEEYVTSDGQAQEFAGLAECGHEFIRKQIQAVWPDPQKRPPTFHTARRVPLQQSRFRPKRFGELAAEIERSLPQRFTVPKDLG